MAAKKKTTMATQSIAQLLDSGNYLPLVTQRHGNRLQHVNFYNTLVTSAFQTGTYLIMIADAILSGATPVTCVFPNAKRRGSQVVSSSSARNRDDFNRTINATLTESLAQTDAAGAIKLAVCYGDHVYICNEISDTVYIVWASHIVYTTARGNVANTTYSNVPVLVNMDGKFRVKNVFILKARVTDSAYDCERVPITKRSPDMSWSMDATPWVCETPPPPPEVVPKNVIRTMTYAAALAAATAKIKPIETRRDGMSVLQSIDAEDELSNGLTVELELSCTPTPHQKECLMGPDPFEEDTDDDN